MLEIRLVRTTTTGKLQVFYTINGINGARFFKDWKALDKFIEQHKLPE